MKGETVNPQLGVKISVFLLRPTNYDLLYDYYVIQTQAPMDRDGLDRLLLGLSDLCQPHEFER